MDTLEIRIQNTYVKSIQNYMIIVFAVSYLPGDPAKIFVKYMIFIRQRYFTKKQQNKT